MKYFADSIIHPHITHQGYREFCEVGASYGENTDRILEAPSVHVTIVDPCLDTDLEAKYASRSNVRVRKGLSLEVLPKLKDHFDCILIDGDHNWFTVSRELEAIHERGLLKPGGTIFLHDVGWPYGRRDMYYQPETIPAEFRLPHAQRGIVHGQSSLAETGGNNEIRFNALHAGGPRNGVLTAVEDFAAAHPGEYWLTSSFEQHGLGVLYRRAGGAADRGFFLLWLRIVARKLETFVVSRKRKLVAAAVLLVLGSILSKLLSRRGNHR